MATNLRFEMGSTVKVRAVFKTPKTASPPSVPIDPTALTLTIRRPDKTTETRVYGVDAIDRIDTGQFTAPIVLSQDGTYHWRWSAENGPTASGVKSGQFDSYRAENF